MVEQCDGSEAVLAEDIAGGDIVLVPHEGGGRRPLHVDSVRREQIVGGQPMVKFTLKVEPPAVRPVVVEVPVGSRVRRLYRSQ
jgi:hypothetical protein